MGKQAVSLSAGLTVDPAALEGLSDADRDRVAGQLRELEAEFKRNPLLAYNHPVLSRRHPKQIEFHAPRADGSWPRIRLFLGGNRSGKTTSTMVDSIIQAVDRDVVPEHLLPFKRWEPPFYCRVVIPDLTRSLEGVTLQKFREWCPRSQLHGSSMDRAWEKQQLMLRFKNGSWVQFMSNDQDLDKFGGAALHRVVYDEEPRGDIRRECLMRLIDFGGEELYGLTPLHGMSWIYDEFYEPFESGHGSDDVRIVTVDMDDNPHLDDATKEWVLGGLGSEERQARKSGRFVSFAGLIYPEWSEGRYVVPAPSELPHGVEVFCGIDPGYRHMCAVLYCYLDHDDDLVVFDEVAMPKTIISEICKEIKLRNMRWGVSPNWYVIDPAARNKNGQTGRSDQQEFADNGIYTIPGQNDVTAGINRVKERLAADRLHVAAACQNLRLEFKKYRWVKETNRGENAALEKPVKKDDHCFPAGTLIRTDAGDVPIERVRIGDSVLTRGGYCTVVASAPTREAELRTLSLADGRELTGSIDHPCVVQRAGRQFVCRLDAVRYDDIMLVCPEAKASSFKESRSGATRTLSSEPTACTSDPTSRIDAGASAISMSRYGRQRTGQCRLDSRSTTLTATPSTTISRISGASPSRSTSGLTWTMNVERDPVGMPRRSDRSRWRGIDRQTAERGIASMVLRVGGTASQSRGRATTAAIASSRSPSAIATVSARTTARARGAERPVSMTFGEIARSAGQRFESTSIPGSTAARVRVVASRAAGSSPVHNLTVLGHSEYFANGVLVLNCLDALRYVNMARPLAPSVEVRRPTDTMKDRLLRHHLRKIRRPPKPDNGFGPGIFC